MKKALVTAFLILLHAVKMKKNVIWINSACVALTLAMMLAVIPAPVEANGQPVIRDFTAYPDTISSGEWAELSWDVSGGQDTIVTLAAFGSYIHRDAAHVAKMKVKPKKTTTYILTATTDFGDGLAVTKSVTVTVAGPTPEPPPPTANQPPVASFSITPANPTPDDTMECHNSSTDPDGDALTYEWYMGGELISRSMDWYYDNPPAGSYTIELVVDDGKGGRDTSTKAITVTSGAAPGDGGCFIATSAYGTETAEELDILRDFRDEVLMQSAAGRVLVRLYYQASPPPADFIAEREFLRTLVREIALDPIVTILAASEDLWND